MTEIRPKICASFIGQTPNLLKGNQDVTVLGFDLSCISLGATKREQKTKHVFRVAVLRSRNIVCHRFHNVIEAENTQSARAYDLRLILT